MINRWGNNERLYFLGLQKSLQMVIAAMKLGHFFLGRKAMTNLAAAAAKSLQLLLTKVHLVKAVIFSSSHVQL